MGSFIVPVDCQHCSFSHGVSFFFRRTETAGVQWPHVEDVDALHLSEDFETLKTGGLFGIGRHGTGLRTRGKKVGHALDL
jgi:hypothetical protein